MLEKSKYCIYKKDKVKEDRQTDRSIYLSIIGVIFYVVALNNFLVSSLQQILKEQSKVKVTLKWKRLIGMYVHTNKRREH